MATPSHDSASPGIRLGWDWRSGHVAAKQHVRLFNQSAEKNAMLHDIAAVYSLHSLRCKQMLALGRLPVASKAPQLKGWLWLLALGAARHYAHSVDGFSGRIGLHKKSSSRCL